MDFGPGRTAAGANSLLTWVERAAHAVTVYYGRFPVPLYRVRVEVVPGTDGVLGGATWGGVTEVSALGSVLGDVLGDPERVSAFTKIQVGENVTDGELVADGAMTRAMVRTAFPAQPKDHAWIEEGLAAYVELVARTQAGFLRPKTAWRSMVRDMPGGNPQPGDKGLDHASNWARAYWGGAQFCLLADVTIRGQTRNGKGLQDALRAIMNQGGTVATRWPLEKAFEAGDRATGTKVLMSQYRRMRHQPVRVDLGGLWSELGVEQTASGDIRFNDAAPLAASRRAIMTVNG